MSDMAGYAARVAVERSGSCRNTNNEDVIWRKTTGVKQEVRMQKEETDLAARTKSFALQIIRLFSRLPKTAEA